jgi:hypothetical protein
VRDPTSPAELELQAQQAQYAAVMQSVNPQGQYDPTQVDVANIRGELDHFKQLYGQSENEKGELRRKVQELLETTNAMMAQYQQAQAQQFVAPQQSPMAYPPPVAPQYGYGPPRDPLADIRDEDMVYGKDVRKLFANEVIPAVQTLAMQNMQLQQQQQQMRQQLMDSSKRAAGITPTDEMRLRQRHPWIAPDNIAAMETMLRMERQQQPGVQPPMLPPQQMAPQAPPSAAPAMPQNVLRRVTFVENTQPQSADLTQDALTTAFNRDMAQAMGLQDDKKASAMRQIAAKYGYKLGDNGQGFMAR